MNTKLVEKNLGKITSKDFPGISVKNEDWKYTGKNVYSVNEFEIGKPVNIEKDETFNIDSNCHEFVVNVEEEKLSLIHI